MILTAYDRQRIADAFRERIGPLALPSDATVDALCANLVLAIPALLETCEDLQDALDDPGVSVLAERDSLDNDLREAQQITREHVEEAIRLRDEKAALERERNRLHSRVFELEHFKGDAERRTRADINRRLLAAVGRVAGMEIDPGSDGVEWVVNKLAGLQRARNELDFECARLVESMEGMQSERQNDYAKARLENARERHELKLALDKANARIATLTAQLEADPCP